MNVMLIDILPVDLYSFQHCLLPQIFCHLPTPRISPFVFGLPHVCRCFLATPILFPPVAMGAFLDTVFML